MRTPSFVLLIALLAGSYIGAQTPPNAGAILIKARSINAGDKSKPSLVRKRFYLFAGGIKDNQPLIDRLKAAEITSRDCYYSQTKASPCFIDWLKAENCETPFCRKVEQADIKGITEFEDAYNKGLVKYNRRPDIALNWLVNNLSTTLTTGFYLKQKGQITAILGALKPIQSTMTTSTAAEALFVGVPAADKPLKYLISNVLPTEVGTKSFAWACEIDVSANKQTALILTADPAKKNCVLTIRDVKICSTGTCEKK